jgi:hypothetical protein
MKIIYGGAMIMKERKKMAEFMTGEIYPMTVCSTAIPHGKLGRDTALFQWKIFV